MHEQRGTYRRVKGLVNYFFFREAVAVGFDQVRIASRSERANLVSEVFLRCRRPFLMWFWNAARRQQVISNIGGHQQDARFFTGRLERIDSLNGVRRDRATGHYDQGD